MLQAVRQAYAPVGWPANALQRQRGRPDEAGTILHVNLPIWRHGIKQTLTAKRLASILQ
jgi:hypothetical protein